MCIFVLAISVKLPSMQAFTENQCLHWVNPLLKYYNYNAAGLDIISYIQGIYQ